VFNFIIVALVFGNIFKIQGASEKLVKMMKYIPTVNSRGGTKIYADDCKGVLRLNNVCFNYPSKKDVQILNDISLDIN
jgi:ABC-type multidrug transport system fused ATPase/permease subunit